MACRLQHAALTLLLCTWQPWPPAAVPWRSCQSMHSQPSSVQWRQQGCQAGQQIAPLRTSVTSHQKRQSSGGMSGRKQPLSAGAVQLWSRRTGYVVTQQWTLLVSQHSRLCYLL